MTKLKELEKRLKDEPDNLGLRVLVASALHEAGRRAASVELYRSVAVAYRDQGRLQQAMTVCRSVLAIEPDDFGCQELLAALVATASDRRPPAEMVSSRLPLPPGSAQDVPEPAAPVGRMAPVDSAGSAGPVEPIEGDEPGQRSPLDVTPLPAPLPYHVAYPTGPSMPVVRPSDLPPSLQEELARYPQILGIANAARQISASLIAANPQVDDDDVSGELQTRRLPKITDADLRKIDGLPPGLVSELHAVPEVIDSDDEPTLLPVTDPPDDSLGVVAVIEDELTEPRELPIRKRPPSIAPPTTATGPLAGAFFVPVPPRNRAAVLHRFRRRLAAQGTTVIQRGETGHGLVIVVHGGLEIHAARPEGAPVVLGAIAPGEFIGETSLLARAPAAADVVAAVDSELLVLGEAEFHEVVGSFPALRSELKLVAERRTREHSQRLPG
jgi:hypothetical protein